VPIESTTNPATNTLPGPYRSATAPATGWTAPQTNWPTASARLIVVMPRPVELFNGETNRPSDCRAPIVTISIAAAASVTIHALRGVAGRVVVVMPRLSCSGSFALRRAAGRG
jgi:hypothetical protein